MRATSSGTKPGEFSDSIKREIPLTARASTATAKDAAAQLKSGVRGVIAGAGFSKRPQNAFRVNVYPSGGSVSMEPSIYSYSAIGYFDIFSSGGTIKGHRGLLWIPLPTIPKLIAGRRTTPRLFEQNAGPLQIFRRPGRNPLLMAKVIRKSRVGKRVALSTFRRGSAASKAGKATNWVPAFVGLSSVTVRKRFNVDPVYQAVVARLPANFSRHMEELSGRR